MVTSILAETQRQAEETGSIREEKGEFQVCPDGAGGQEAGGVVVTRSRCYM